VQPFTLDPREQPAHRQCAQHAERDLGAAKQRDGPDRAVCGHEQHDGGGDAGEPRGRADLQAPARDDHHGHRREIDPEVLRAERGGGEAAHPAGEGADELVARLAERVGVVVLRDGDCGDGGPERLLGVEGEADAVGEARAAYGAQRHQQALHRAALQRQALERADGGLLERRKVGEKIVLRIVHLVWRARGWGARAGWGEGRIARLGGDFG
jgi:hypothetical protein